MRIRLLQAVALVALLHTLTPLVDPASIGPDELAEHYGETIRLEGRVTQVDPSGEVVRLLVATADGQATVLTRGEPAPVGANVTLRGTPSPGRTGPVVWAEGSLQHAQPAAGARLGLAELLQRAPRLAPSPVAVTGTYDPERGVLDGSQGSLPVDPGPVSPEPGPVLLWGRLVYEPAQAGYELEATGWRPWTPPRP